MKSPFQHLRELGGLSQNAFCAKYGFSKMPLVYTEAAVYPQVSERFRGALFGLMAERGIDVAEELREQYSYPTLDEATHFYQRLARREFGARIAGVEPTYGSRYESPFGYFVLETAGSHDGFAKKLKVPPASVVRHSTGKTLTMPRTIAAALTEAGYPHLKTLNERQLMYFDKSRAA